MEEIDVFSIYVLLTLLGSNLRVFGSFEGYTSPRKKRLKSYKYRNLLDYMYYSHISLIYLFLNSITAWSQAPRR